MNQRESSEGHQAPSPPTSNTIIKLPTASISVRVLKATISTGNVDQAGILLQAVITPGNKTQEGQLVQAVAIPWFEIIRLMEREPSIIYEIDWRQWEEIIAGAYERAGFDEVILTPRSGDKGRDVIATKHGIGSVRFFDQVKAYSPNHFVTANDVRAMAGVLSGAGNVSKGIITTTSEFAPGVEEDEYIKPFIPYRLELKPRDKLIPWLISLAQPDKPEGSPK